jgi:leucyl-tRNA synthetase
MVARYGADATRMYSLFATPPDRDLDWQEDGVAGVSRFLSKVYRLAMKYADRARPFADGQVDEATASDASLALLRTTHQTIRKISEDFGGRWHFNTSISALMSLLNEVTAAEPKIDAGEVSDFVVSSILTNLTLLLAPFAPFLAAELWEQLGNTTELLRQPWPQFDAALAAEEVLEIPVQVNGKLRAVISVPAGSDEEAIRAAVGADEKVKTFIAGKNVVKLIYVPGKLVNIVVK